MKSKLCFTILVAIALQGCNTLNFQIADEPATNVEHDRKSFFFWGLAPTRVVDIGAHCPNGVKSVKEETTFGDGFLSLITLGIYSPRSSTYVCR